MAEYVTKEQVIDWYRSYGQTDEPIPFETLVSDLRDMKAADVVPVQEWVSIDDRLPEEGEYVLCSLKGFNYGGNIQVCKFVPADKFKDKPYFEHFRNGFPSVTHWMPLPQPPKGE